MTKSEKAFLERYIDNSGTKSNTTTVDIAVGILAREVMKSAIKDKEQVLEPTELGEPEAYDITKKISMNEDNLMAAIQVLETEVKASMRKSNSIESWDERTYKLFRDFRNMLYRIKDK